MGRARRKAETPLDIDVRTLSKLASIVGHVDEWLGSGGHEFDLAAIKALMAEQDVQQWLDAMRKLSLAPLPRQSTEVGVTIGSQIEAPPLESRPRMDLLR